MSKRPQHSPYHANPKKYGKDAQLPIPPDYSSRLNVDYTKEVEPIVGSVLYYARAVDLTTPMGLSSISSKQSTTTTKTTRLC